MHPAFGNMLPGDGYFHGLETEPVRQVKDLYIEGETIDITEARRVIAGYNGRLDLDSQGAVLFREWLTAYEYTETFTKSSLFAVPFDAKDPLNLCPCDECPDQDLDGICDAVDDCPKDATNSCAPCEDNDADGICNWADPCPNDPVNYCPACTDKTDPDSDGIPNCADSCPNDPFNSCVPCNDRDGDLICDDFDYCPDDATNQCANCADDDSDGICNPDDECPKDPINACKPCPDHDLDGMCDEQDLCPDDPNDLCKSCCDPADDDNDGTPNCVDPCPQDATDKCWCPDFDLDGICDFDDPCPETASENCDVDLSGGGCACGTSGSKANDFTMLLLMFAGLGIISRIRRRRTTEFDTFA